MVYSQISFHNEVVEVDVDSEEIEKRKTFATFEDENSHKRVVMGTKLLSNGLDCKSVQFVCLVDSYLNCVDYLQMVGRIRQWGLVKVLVNESRKPYPQNTEIGRLFPELDWKQCISKQVAEFYEVPYNEHNGCCGIMKGDARIEEMKWILGGENVERAFEHQNVDIISDDNTNNDVDWLSDDSLCDELCSDNLGNLDQREMEWTPNNTSGIDNISIMENPVTKAVKNVLTEDNRQTLIRNWNDILKLDFNVKSLRELTLYINPKYIVIWDGTISPSLCDDCLMPLHNEENCGALLRTVGKFIYEYLATYKILKSKNNFERKKMN